MSTVAFVDSDAPDSYNVYFRKTYGQAHARHESAEWTTLASADNSWRVPLLLRPLCGPLVDAVSPYGYSGIGFTGADHREAAKEHWDDALDALRDRGVVSLFLRFSAFDGVEIDQLRGLAGLEIHESSRTHLVITDDETRAWHRLSGRSRTAVRKAISAGLRADVSAVDPDGSDNLNFRGLYESTMDRIGAGQAYYFDENYYKDVSGLGDRVRQINIRDGSGNIVSAALLLVDKKFVHYHLAGSLPEFARFGANNLLIWSAIIWAVSQQRVGLHLGGGVSERDGLDRFKSSFGGRTLPFAVGRVITNEKIYREMVTQAAEELSTTVDQLEATHFFPAYRASVAS